MAAGRSAPFLPARLTCCGEKFIVRSVDRTICDIIIRVMKVHPRSGAAEIIRFAALSLALFAATVALAQPKLEEFYDKDFGYSFQYPAGWRLQNLPEGEANRDIRAMLQGPSGSSFMAIMEKNGAKNAGKDDVAAEERKGRVEALMSRTIEQVYKTVAANIKAVAMTVGERRDISNGVAIKFYISTLHQMPDGKPIIVAGIHSYPFGKDYAVSFIMTAFSEGTTDKEQETLIGVFNSFRLLGERPAADESVKPANPDGK
jgi:hypothetical protein